VSSPYRLPARPTEVLDRNRQLAFSFNGRRHFGHPGDTIASALAAAGVRVFSRSFKYHRPRGIMTAGWLDPGLMVQVGDDPNVRAGHRLVAEGLTVTSQDTWPSLRVDAKSVNGALGRFLGPGFYYKTFIRPRRLWPAYEAVLQRFVHAGRVDPDTPRLVTDVTHEHADVVVVGGGPAGMAAALGAADDGARVVLVDEDHELGGHWRWSPEHADRLSDVRSRVEAHPGITAFRDSVVIGRYDGNWLGIVVRSPDGSERLVRSRATSLVVAPGLVERPLVFPGNDRPGVVLGTAVRRLVNLYAVRPGDRAVVLSANAHGDAAAADLEQAGVEVVARLDARRGGTVRAVSGRGRVQTVEDGDGRRHDADLLVVSTGWTAPTSLLNMAGCVPVYEPSVARFLPGPLPDDVLATGGVVGDGDADELLAHATATGREAARRAAVSAARRARAVPTRPDDAAELVASQTRIDIPALPLASHPQLFRSGDGFVDFSEDVSAHDLEQAVAEGYASAELAKRYTTATMGPLQGKLETVNAVAVAAGALGQGIAETGTTTWRPPYAPPTLGALAGRELQPVRVSPMQDWHEAAGAVPLLAGAWVRPEHYGDPQAEVRAVRGGVGIIDVTPLGKLDLRGPDVAALLERLYTNRWAGLAVGRVRYGVMCTEDGIVLDDGVTGRLGEEHYLMTTTSGGAATVWEWVENWLQTDSRSWRVHCTPVTTAYASINVAGPHSRTLLSRLTDLDLAPEAFPYMHVRSGTVAGVDDVVCWRIGFTGELSYELHVPAAFGLHVWEALLEAGADLGVVPFGIEAQRVLRLEKGHLVVGQDTDGLTSALAAGMDWAVRLDKDDFAGQPELRWEAETGPAMRLVALRPRDPAAVPVEASQLLDRGTEILGRITSSRYSPTLERGVCLGQVRADRSAPGTVLGALQPDGSVLEVTVCEQLAQVDPDGGRLRA
jgi:sarcosine oxidase subunit alpha